MIPQFGIDGILPPFQGDTPAGDSALMSPYTVDLAEIVERFGATESRRRILKGWLNHRAALRAVGIDRGFQWLDGSFVEEKEPRDLDVVTFFHRPVSIYDPDSLWTFWQANQSIMSRSTVKEAYHLDAFFLDLNGDPEDLVSTTRYFLQLFSHQRETFLWKGMLQVKLDDPEEDRHATALLALGSEIDMAGRQR